MAVKPGPTLAENHSAAPVDLTCGSCGAVFSIVGNDLLHCPFCDSDQISLTAPTADNPVPTAVVPFAIAADEARIRYQRWLGGRIFRPHDLNRVAMGRLEAVYVPAWSHQATARSTWTSADGVASGEHTGRFRGLLVSASRGLPADWIVQVSGYALVQQQPSTVGLVRGRIVETATPEADPVPAARKQIAAAERDACAAADEAPLSGLNVRTEIADLSGSLLLLPVWIGSFHYKDRLYRCLINGQTGSEAGEAPVSGLKIAVIFAAVVVAILIVLALSQLYGQ